MDEDIILILCADVFASISFEMVCDDLGVPCKVTISSEEARDLLRDGSKIRGIICDGDGDVDYLRERSSFPDVPVLIIASTHDESSQGYMTVKKPIRTDLVVEQIMEQVKKIEAMRLSDSHKGDEKKDLRRVA